MKIKIHLRISKGLSKFYIVFFSSKCFIAKQIIAELCNKWTCSVIKNHPMNINISLLVNFYCVTRLYALHIQIIHIDLWMIWVQREYKKGLLIACRLWNNFTKYPNPCALEKLFISYILWFGSNKQLNRRDLSICVQLYHAVIKYQRDLYY